MGKRQDKHVVKGLRFVGIFAAFVLMFYTLPYDYLPWAQMEFLTAFLSVFVLNLFGSDFALVSATMFSNGSLTAEIIPLCTGYLELVVLVGFIFASEDRSLQNRFRGAVGGFAFLLVLNNVRIALTINLVEALGLGFLEVVHDVLFRLVLFTVVVGYYFVWYTKAYRKIRFK